MPLTSTGDSPILVHQEDFFGISRNEKTTDNYVQKETVTFNVIYLNYVQKETVTFNVIYLNYTIYTTV